MWSEPAPRWELFEGRTRKPEPGSRADAIITLTFLLIVVVGCVDGTGMVAGSQPTPYGPCSMPCNVSSRAWAARNRATAARPFCRDDDPLPRRRPFPYRVRACWRIVLWTLAGIVMLDIVIAGVFAACAAGYRYRGLRQLRHLEAMWTWRAATCVVLPVGQAPGATAARDAPVAARAPVILAGTAMANRRGARRRGLRAGHPRLTPRDRPRSTGHRRGGSRRRRARPVHFARTRARAASTERSNPGVDQRTASAQSQPAQTDPPFDRPDHHGTSRRRRRRPAGRRC